MFCEIKGASVDPCYAIKWASKIFVQQIIGERFFFEKKGFNFINATELQHKCYKFTQTTFSLNRPEGRFSKTVGSVCCVSPPGNPASWWTGDFWSMSVSLILAN